MVNSILLFITKPFRMWKEYVRKRRFAKKVAQMKEEDPFIYD